MRLPVVALAVAVMSVSALGVSATRRAGNTDTPQTNSASANRPNVVFILTDDVGYGDISANGAARVKTPNIDRIAAEGQRTRIRRHLPDPPVDQLYNVVTDPHEDNNVAAQHPDVLRTMQDLLARVRDNP